ncbi:spindle pole body component 110-like protein [Gossypium australe]|uniref:Spindle pole body component 110-like protein n=1 Tax=Gossypium australe TaxID=47621 RepID=A0A5B6VE09_9ROSI|nr:spindle pole body component 110-like protein [Gossypium australe]
MVEEYTTLLCCPRVQVDKAYFRAANDLILAHLDEKKKIDVFVLCIYGLVIFPKVLKHVDEVVTDLFDRLDKGVTPLSAILAETFRSLNAFGGLMKVDSLDAHSYCWFGSIRVDKLPYRMFFESFSPLKEAAATTRRDDILEER